MKDKICGNDRSVGRQCVEKIFEALRRRKIFHQRESGQFEKIFVENTKRENIKREVKFVKIILVRRAIFENNIQTVKKRKKYSKNGVE